MNGTETPALTFAASTVILGHFTEFAGSCRADNPSGPWDLEDPTAVEYARVRRTIRASVCSVELGFGGAVDAEELAQDFLEVLLATLEPEIPEATLCAA